MTPFDAESSSEQEKHNCKAVSAASHELQPHLGVTDFSVEEFQKYKKISNYERSANKSKWVVGTCFVELVEAS